MATATATQTQTNGATSLEMMEAIVTSGLLKGKTVNLVVVPDSVLDKSEAELTPEEMEVLEAVVEASKKAEASAIRAGKTAERIIEKRRRSTAALRGEMA